MFTLVLDIPMTQRLNSIMVTPFPKWLAKGLTVLIIAFTSVIIVHIIFDAIVLFVVPEEKLKDYPSLPERFGL